MMDILSKITELLKMSRLWAFAISAAIWVLVFLSDDMASRLRVSAVRDQFGGYAVVVALVLAIYVIASWLVAVGRGIRSWRLNERRFVERQRHIRETILRLTGEERQFLRTCLDGQTNTTYCRVTDSVAHSLAAKGLVEKAGGLGSMSKWPVVVSGDVWLMLNLQPQLLDHVEAFIAPNGDA